MVNESASVKCVLLVSGSFTGIALYYLIITLFVYNYETDVETFLMSGMTAALGIFTISVFWILKRQLMSISSYATISGLIVWIICLIVYLIRKFKVVFKYYLIIVSKLR